MTVLGSVVQASLMFAQLCRFSAEAAVDSPCGKRQAARRVPVGLMTESRVGPDWAHGLQLADPWCILFGVCDFVCFTLNTTG